MYVAVSQFSFLFVSVCLCVSCGVSTWEITHGYVIIIRFRRTDICQQY